MTKERLEKIRKFFDVAEPTKIECEMLAEIDRLRDALKNIVLHARDELDVRIARAALEQK